MKYLIVFILLIVSVNTVAQFGATQSMGTVNTRVVSNGAFDATKGLINGVFADTTAANASPIDFYNGAQIWTSSDRNFWLRSTTLNMWIRMAKFSDVGGAIPTLQQVLTAGSTTAIDNTISIGSNDFNIENGTEGGLNINQASRLYRFGNYNGSNGTQLSLDDVNALIELRDAGGTGFYSDGINQIMSMKIAGTSILTLDGPNDLATINDMIVKLSDKSTPGTPASGTGYLYVNTDSLRFKNDAGTIFTLGTTTGGGSGTINSGTTGKPAYYTGATTLDDFAAVDYATSGTNVLITTQNTTDVGLNIKGQSSQSANYLNISTSAGTGDLAFINASGEMIFGGNTDAGVYDLQINDGLWVNNVSAAAGNGLVLSPSTTISSGFVIQNNSGGEWIMAALNATSLKMFTSSSPIYISPGGTDKAVFLSGGGMTMPEGSAPGTPASAMAVIYPKSDGLWYGKDDAGAETKLSNPSLNKGAFIALPTSTDTVDVWQTPVAITITSLKAVLRGSSPSVTYNIGFGTSIQSPTAVFTSDITCTSITTGCSNSSGFNDATIPAGSFIWIYTNAASGTIRSIAFTINYTED